MQALTPMQRGYVLAMLSNPFGSARQWALAAGYSDVKDGAKVRAFELQHNPKIEAAANEVARRAMGGRGAILGVAVTMRIAADPKHPKQLRAAEMLMNRVGLHEKTEHVVNVAHTLNSDDLVGRIEKAAKALGVDPKVLLGENAAPKLIEAKVEERPVDRQDD